MYGADRLRQFVGDSQGSLAETVQRLMADAHTFSGGRLHDDLCLVACQRIRSR
jgi:hypothetical protein